MAQQVEEAELPHNRAMLEPEPDLGEDLAQPVADPAERSPDEPEIPAPPDLLQREIDTGANPAQAAQGTAETDTVSEPPQPPPDMVPEGEEVPPPPPDVELPVPQFAQALAQVDDVEDRFGFERGTLLERSTAIGVVGDRDTEPWPAPEGFQAELQEVMEQAQEALREPGLDQDPEMMDQTALLTRKGLV